ncbi:tetratricopeptide repeat protein [Phototrophicus methaneseepsis]|uniref:Tetratricopeptide repeat protein n=1 Tax=Phototrophicus methaneseepsis TaxID=2710758 RepID=A0A7S8E6C9_9CHLR|nr:tetratricopeptide repeat protein [Phototrophicus methaneseepsis]QPC81140.1 tetratricopeptide repeat protein [Phototrophicus methaneseepsis]
MKRKLLLAIVCFGIAGCTPSAAERNNAANHDVQTGEIESAIAAYQQAQVLEPDNAVLYYNAADALQQANRVTAAVEALEFAIAQGDDDLKAVAYYNLGRIYFLGEDYEQAIFAFQEVLRLTPDNNDARFNLELALASILQPTPTALEMQTEPEDSPVNEQATPTPAPGDISQLTPTPTPPPEGTRIGPTPIDEGSDGAPIEDMRSTPQPEVDGDLTIDQAERILDQIKLDADVLGDFKQQEATPSSTQSEKDW